MMLKAGVMLTAWLAGFAACDDAAGRAAESATEQTVVADTVPLRYLIGDVDPANDTLFAPIPEWLRGNRAGYGHRDAVADLARMAEAAKADGITLRVVSPFRSYRDQVRIWEGKWNGTTAVDGGKLPETHPDPKVRALKILEYSSMPATSRHHWGTDFDFNSLSNSWFDSGEGKRVYDWLNAHAASYGFCQVYTVKGSERSTGYEEERWHWSYIPVAARYLEQYPVTVGYDHITGFAGHETAADIDVIANYVQAIGPLCRRP